MTILFTVAGTHPLRNAKIGAAVYQLLFLHRETGVTGEK